MRIAAIQHDIIWQTRAANLGRYKERIATAASMGAQLIVLSEMYSTGFSMETDEVAEEPDGPSASFLVDQAEETGVWLCASMPVRSPDYALPVNRMVLAGPGGERHHYDKIHPFSYGGEDEHYSPGTDFLNEKIRGTTDDTAGLRFSGFICYDLRFADEFWGLAHDTDLYVVPANWPAKRAAHWRALLVARAIENQAYVVGVNRVGSGGGLDYCGDSLIVDPLGNILADGVGGQEQILTAEIDPDHLRQVRERFPFLQDRR